LLHKYEFLKLGLFINAVLIVASILGSDLFFSPSHEVQSRTDDKIPPVITLPGDSTLEAISSNGRIVNYKVAANDEVDGIVRATCTPTSGSNFPIGNTKVVCVATDKNGNKAVDSFQVRIQDNTPPDTAIVGSKVGWFGKLNSTSVTISDDINFEILGRDAVGLGYYECKIDSGEWTRIPNHNTKNSICSFSHVPDGIHIFQSRAVDKYGNFDKSPATFTWTVLSLEDGLKQIINLTSDINLTERELAVANLPLVESQKLLPLKTVDIRINVCYNMDSFLVNINNLLLKNILSEPSKNTLLASVLSIKDRIGCTTGLI